jgi:single-stranded-DNA-specific exonuclease
MVRFDARGAPVAPRRIMARTWPADPELMDRARELLKCAPAPVAIAMDKDVDGLSAGILVARALARLGKPAPLLFPAGKGEHIHTPAMRERIADVSPALLVVTDMGARTGAILPAVPTVIIDHHQPSGTPPGALLVTGFGHEPVAPTSLLAYHLVRRLAPVEDLEWLALLGLVADLGVDAPFADLPAALKRHGRKDVTEAVALLNASRRAPGDPGRRALGVLLAARGPRDISAGLVPGVEELRRCRAVVQAELARCSRVPPRFLGRVALLRFSSEAQIHPVVATRWTRRLAGHIVIAANDGYLPGRVSFAMRTTASVNLVALLRGLPTGPVAGEFAHGHPRATGGSVPPADFERILGALGERQWTQDGDELGRAHRGDPAVP